ncbi:efflux transporter outer membrane subunit [Verminephrobacter aporrectodeae]|uniref:efflux transporter outer membrane subunit n=1 Tax=Verminephrobacter aporrectodeae TaxID=1110389 RepID=UPI002243965E|nr:efflux transporter outer membrane subunit [Verminephrobacter aporrectodeae]MCW8175290.1 efflux transporter outer membrane subunit [Verminephrobacter aporrectodeae subsp. tuberculatae]MCW8202775.1 efflux transporter outer membrane subunit [Verminephrobacter aporrectodeae subsp. tuberculatae]
MKLCHRILLTLCMPLALVACATPAPPATVAASVPAAWNAPLPHQGSLQDLSRWWTQLGDPLLVELMAAAQDLSPDLAQARARIAQARAVQVASRADLGPSLDAQAKAGRGFNEQLGHVASTAQAGLATNWELDLFGANAAAETAAGQRLAGAQALWHEARVSVAAEVAQQTSSLRSCLEQFDLAERDAHSRAETERLSALSERAGFTAPATAALARASAAQAQARAAQQRMQCDVGFKVLVALTGWQEPALRARLAAAPGGPAPDALFALAALPAQVLAQRPDVYHAEREVAATSAELGQAQAQRYPRLALSGSISAAWLRNAGATTDLGTWSIGPLTLSLPLFDGGRRAAQTDAARARYDEAAALYRARVRQAVSEVEQALVRLASTAERNASARTAAEGYRASFAATESGWRAGLTSLLELEDARRNAFAAEDALIALRNERQLAWIALYRAAGGGWDAQQGLATAQSSDTPDSSAR